MNARTLSDGDLKVLVDLQLSKYVNVATFAVLVYDYFTTLSDEINYVWPSKWNAGKVLYIVQRYTVFVDPILFLIYILSPDLNPKTCRTVFSTFAGFAVCGAMISEVILSMRTYAIWGRSNSVLSLLVTLNLASFTARAATARQYLNNIQPVPYPVGVFISCIPVRYESQIPVWIMYAVVLLLELTIVVLTVYKAFATLECRRGNSAHPRSSRTNAFTTTLYYDAMTFFIILFLLSVANEVISANPKYFNLISLLTETQRVVHAILSGKIILHLRKAAQHSLGHASFFSLETANTFVFENPARAYSRVVGPDRLPSHPEMGRR